MGHTHKKIAGFGFILSLFSSVAFAANLNEKQFEALNVALKPVNQEHVILRSLLRENLDNTELIFLIAQNETLNAKASRVIGKLIKAFINKKKIIIAAQRELLAQDLPFIMAHLKENTNDFEDVGCIMPGGYTKKIIATIDSSLSSIQMLSAGAMCILGSYNLLYPTNACTLVTDNTIQLFDDMRRTQEQGNIFISVDNFNSMIQEKKDRVLEFENYSLISNPSIAYCAAAEVLYLTVFAKTALKYFCCANSNNYNYHTAAKILSSMRATKSNTALVLVDKDRLTEIETELKGQDFVSKEIGELKPANTISDTPITTGTN